MFLCLVFLCLSDKVRQGNEAKIVFALNLPLLIILTLNALYVVQIVNTMQGVHKFAITNTFTSNKSIPGSLLSSTHECDFTAPSLTIVSETMLGVNVEVSFFDWMYCERAFYRTELCFFKEICIYMFRILVL